MKAMVVTAPGVVEYKDVLTKRQFSDTIALGGHFLDLHDSKEAGVRSGETDPTQMVSPYQIPFRTPVPQKVDNLLVAGRCHSVDHLAAASTRVALTAGVMGEAAGYGAYLSLRGNCSPAEINTHTLREMILNNNGIWEV